MLHAIRSIGNAIGNEVNIMILNSYKQKTVFTSDSGLKRIYKGLYKKSLAVKYLPLSRKHLIYFFKEGGMIFKKTLLSEILLSYLGRNMNISNQNNILKPLLIAIRYTSDSDFFWYISI